MLSRAELRPWRDLAGFALDQWGFGAHPAVRAAERQLEALIADPGNMPSKYARHFLRLGAAGVDGRKMLLRIMAVYGIRYLGHPGSLSHGDAVFWANLGSYFLRSAPVGNKPAHWYTGKGGDQFRVSGMVCHDVGCALAEKIGSLCIQLWSAIESERKRRDAAGLEIREALERCPL